MTGPTFSVITPSLNPGRFIAAAVESVLAQAGEAVEHVVDGGPIDETRNVLARFPHLTIMQDPARGQSHAMNLGLDAGSGEFSAWLNEMRARISRPLAGFASWISRR